MKIIDIINSIKQQCCNNWYEPIDDATTRDQILYGNPEQEVTGIVSTCFASVEVINKTIELGYNFIIVHEALFWNHGDHQEWLKDNVTYQKKVALLEKGNICVWRIHDYIHAGLSINGTFKDGIFYGLSKKLGWLEYSANGFRSPLLYNIPEISCKDLMKHLMDSMGLNGIKTMGDLNCTVKKVLIAPHLFGQIDNKITELVDKENIDCIIAMEITDFTTAEYIRDSAMLGEGRVILACGHFNTEEPGMEFFAEYLPEMIGNEVPVCFIQSGDAYTLVNRKDI